MQAESVSRNLNVPVLIHGVKKPACIKPIKSYFSKSVIQPYPSQQLFVDSLLSSAPASASASNPASTSPEERDLKRTGDPIVIAIIGDRLSTDIVLANRLSKESGWKVCSVLTTKLPEENEEFGTRLMRRMEWAFYNLIMRWRARKYRNENTIPPPSGWADCVIPNNVAYPPLPPTRAQVVLRTGFRWSWLIIAWLAKHVYYGCRHSFGYIRKQIVLKNQERKSKVVT